MSLLSLALLCALTAAGTTFVIRAVVQELRPLWLLAKPLSCDLCMNWWASLAVAAALHEQIPVSPVAGVVVLGSTGLGVLVTKVVGKLSD